MAWLAPVMLLVSGACGGTYGGSEPFGNTGPGATVSRIAITTVNTQVTVGDSIIFSGKAYDSASQELPVAIFWNSTDVLTLSVDPATGHGRANRIGQASVFATVGSSRSPFINITIGP